MGSCRIGCSGRTPVFATEFWACDECGAVYVSDSEARVDPTPQPARGDLLRRLIDRGWALAGDSRRSSMHVVAWNEYVNEIPSDGVIVSRAALEELRDLADYGREPARMLDSEWRRLMAALGLDGGE